MAEKFAPYLWLGPRWYAWLEFGPDGRRATFLEIARRVCNAVGGSAVETLPSSRDEDKEYWQLQVGLARLLLMRKPPLGVGLGAALPDLPLLLRIGAMFGAECRGWRWPFYRLWRWLGGGGARPS